MPALPKTLSAADAIANERKQQAFHIVVQRAEPVKIVHRLFLTGVHFLSKIWLQPCLTWILVRGRHIGLTVFNLVTNKASNNRNVYKARTRRNLSSEIGLNASLYLQ
eukprot:3335-Heterococcus_DN1.PRE.4